MRNPSGRRAGAEPCRIRRSVRLEGEQIGLVLTRTCRLRLLRRDQTEQAIDCRRRGAQGKHHDVNPNNGRKVRHVPSRKKSQQAACQRKNPIK
jgi:hypothetical protein